MNKHHLGIDGCKSAWFVISIFERVEFSVCTSIHEIVKKYPDFKQALIDIPIGLTESSSGRECDRLARNLLKPRRSSSVFSAPCHAVLEASSYQEANRISKSQTSKGLSAQAFGIVPKIKEVNSFLMANSSYKNTLLECHPEICFAFLNNKIPMQHNKKTVEGYLERLEIIKRYDKNSQQYIEAARAQYPKSMLASDDILDAYVAAVVSKLSDEFGLLHIPEIPPADENGLPMQMVCVNPHPSPLPL